MNFLKKALIIADAAISATVAVAVASSATTVVSGTTAVAGAISTQSVSTPSGVMVLSKITAPLWYKVILGIIVFSIIFFIGYKLIEFYNNKHKK